ncbi:MAG: hypothetical protein N2316_00540 [Spirochaetes bacterium]|nr:hypothetical protein [Spirochaetota bacterium]
MKRIMSNSAIVIICFTVFIPIFSCKKKSTFGELLIEVEASVLPQSQTDTWPQRKAAWVQDVKNAQNDVSVLRKLLIEFETNIQYSAQKPYWHERRNGWLESVSNASSISQLRDLLIELESSFTFSTQSPEWQEKRSDWYNRLQAVE